ncbi:hypothetical protein [Mycobacterium sp. D16R24]|uniref:hypothetical protein n=1 Tax=Mycobacterium sp. D16R24 TaxID=1855656 RepID=UPI00099483B6|nr:hypothetical protein [Mycobacterium sp. D16R24]
MSSPDTYELVQIVLHYVFAMVFAILTGYTLRVLSAEVRFYSENSFWRWPADRVLLGAMNLNMVFVAVSLLVVKVPTAEWRRLPLQTTWDWVIAWGHVGYTLTSIGSLVLALVLMVGTVVSRNVDVIVAIILALLRGLRRPNARGGYLDANHPREVMQGNT